MFAYAVRRALRTNKTLRYGVPMLVSPAEGKVCVGGGWGGGIPRGWDLKIGWDVSAVNL